VLTSIMLYFESKYNHIMAHLERILNAVTLHCLLYIEIIAIASWNSYNIFGFFSAKFLKITIHCLLYRNHRCFSFFDQKILHVLGGLSEHIRLFSATNRGDFFLDTQPFKKSQKV
jgi:hypothetical protein